MKPLAAVQVRGECEMKVPVIGCEDWLNVWEKSATWDIAQSTFASFTMDELMQRDGEGGASG